MEPIIVIVGFLGAGKTTLLKKLTQEYSNNSWSPFIILNDYENASMDSQQFLDLLPPLQVNALTGSCICCSGIHELRNRVNAIPAREKGITFIEANGTTDACELMGFLGVGINEQFLPPIQISVVDVKNWQKRGPHNELEANQVQVSSIVILNHLQDASPQRIKKVESDVFILNPSAKVQAWSDFDSLTLLNAPPCENQPQTLDHAKTHWASCSVDLPPRMMSADLKYVVDSLPKSILRLKGCTKLDRDEYYSFFERVPSGEVMVRPYRGAPVTGPKLLIVGPGSDPELLKKLLMESTAH